MLVSPNRKKTETKIRSLIFAFVKNVHTNQGTLEAPLADYDC